MSHDRLARMEQIQVAPLDRRLPLELPAAESGRGQDRAAMLDHRERSTGSLELPDDGASDVVETEGHRELAGLVGESRDGNLSRLEVGGDLGRMVRVAVEDGDTRSFSPPLESSPDPPEVHEHALRILPGDPGEIALGRAGGPLTSVSASECG